MIHAGGHFGFWTKRQSSSSHPSASNRHISSSHHLSEIPFPHPRFCFSHSAAEHEPAAIDWQSITPHCYRAAVPDAAVATAPPSGEDLEAIWASVAAEPAPTWHEPLPASVSAWPDWPWPWPFCSQPRAGAAGAVEAARTAASHGVEREVGPSAEAVAAASHGVEREV